MRTGLRVGSVVCGRWRIDAQIGRGAMSIVWAATHRNGDRVAIKVLKPEVASDPKIRERFLRESYVANRVGHPRAVRVIDDDVAPDGSPLLVMDLLEGATLEKQRVEAGGTLPVDEVVRRLVELLGVLDAAHAKGIVHRDIKPENLFIDTEGHLRVLDFGLARAKVSRSEFATLTGDLMGTPQFMAPEQAAGRTSEIDARTDLFSVAATGFMLISGRPVHEATSLPEMINAIVAQEARSITSVAPDTPAGVADVIDRGLRRSRDARWSSAAAMRAALITATDAAPDTHAWKTPFDDDATEAKTKASRDVFADEAEPPSEHTALLEKKEEQDESEPPSEHTALLEKKEEQDESEPPSEHTALLEKKEEQDESEPPSEHTALLPSSPLHAHLPRRPRSGSSTNESLPAPTSPARPGESTARDSSLRATTRPPLLFIWLAFLALAGVGTAGIVASMSANQSPERPAVAASESAAGRDPRKHASADPASASPAESTTPPGDFGVLVVEANAPIAVVRIGEKETTVARPSRRAIVPITEDQSGRELNVTVIAVDGRRVEGKGMAGAKPMSVSFGGVAPRPTARPPSPTH